MLRAGSALVCTAHSLWPVRCMACTQRGWGCEWAGGAARHATVCGTRCGNHWPAASLPLVQNKTKPPHLLDAPSHGGAHALHAQRAVPVVRSRHSACRGAGSARRVLRVPYNKSSCHSSQGNSVAAAHTHPTPPQAAPRCSPDARITCSARAEGARRTARLPPAAAPRGPQALGRGSPVCVVKPMLCVASRPKISRASWPMLSSLRRQLCAGSTHARHCSAMVAWANERGHLMRCVAQRQLRHSFAGCRGSTRADHSHRTTHHVCGACVAQVAARVRARAAEARVSAVRHTFLCKGVLAPLLQ